MSRNKKNIRFKVGVFLLTGFGCLFVYIIFMGKHSFFYSSVHYKINFQEVHGLFAGSQVTVNGMAAGHVEQIKLIPQNGYVQVSISVLKKFADTLTDQSKAHTVTKGLLGDKYVSLITSGQRGSVLPPGSFIPTSARDNLLGLLGGGGHRSPDDPLSAILNEVLIFLKSLNSQATGQKLNQVLEGLTSALASVSREDTAELVYRLKSILRKIDEGKGTAGALINNKNIYQRILSLLGRKPYHQYLPRLLQQESPSAENK